MFNKLKNLLNKKSTHKSGEELSEKKTTKGGYFLLVLMFFAIISTAQWTINIIQDIPEPPDKPPYCIESIVKTFENKNHYTYKKTCDNYELRSSKPEYDFTTEYNLLKDEYETILSLKKQINNLESDNSKLERDKNEYDRDYKTSLTEDIAGKKDGVYNNSSRPEDNLKQTNTQIERNQSKIRELEKSISSIINQNSQTINQLEQKLEKVQDEYSKLYIIYKIYIAVLSLIFALTVFLIVYRIYSKLKLENSPYTIIFSTASFAYGLILLQVVVWFLWDIIPKKILGYVLEFLSAFQPAIYLLQFIWPIFIVGIFGFIVYKIQKRLYSKENIIKRFISDKKCPNCGNEVDITKPYCPLCSNEIQIKCPHCGEHTVKGMPYCSSCGSDLNDSEE